MVREATTMTPTTASCFAGFDVSQFPGRKSMAWLRKNTNLRWTGFYLGPAPSHSDAGWMGQYQFLTDTDLGKLPIYVGQQVTGPGSHTITSTQGRTDGDNACALMTKAGFPRGSHVWLDLENGPPLTAPQVSYITAWAAAVKAGGFAPEVYCSHLLAPQVVPIIGGSRPWVFEVATTAVHSVSAPYSVADPSGSGYKSAWAWQHDQNAQINCDGSTLVVDLSTALAQYASSP